MIRLNFLFCFLFCVYQLTAQNIEIPQILVVTVNHAEGKPAIEWSVEHPELIDGYIIKRDIIDFPNSYGYNTVAIINDPYTFEYTDLSTVYGPARPDLRSESYRVLAFDSIGDERFLSPMSEPHSTIFLTGDFDYCERASLLKWNRYSALAQSMNSYNVYNAPMGETFTNIAQTIFPDTSFSAEISEFNTNTDYYVSASGSTGYESRSNLISIYSQAPEQPQYIHITQLSNEQTGFVYIEFEADQAEAVQRYHVTAIAENHIDTVYSLTPDGTGSYEFEIPQKNSEQYTDYRIFAVDYCPLEILSSLQRRLLTVKCDPVSEGNYLNRISIHGVADASDFEIYRAENGRNMSLLASSADIPYTDEINEFMLAQLKGEQPQAFMQYQLQGEYKGCLYLSDIVSCIHRPVLITYNAVHPLSPYAEDRIFRPFAVNISDYEMIIYDESGAVIFYSSDPQQGWDGKFPSGKLAPRGAYIYSVRYRDAFGNLYDEKAIVNVVY